MLRVGLTGELGSGKSTVARMLAARGAIVLSSDEMGRTMMQPGHPVYAAIVESFGPSVLLPDGELNRTELARLAFHSEHPRVEELNAIIHPAVLAEQEHRLAEIAKSQPDAIVVIESALIFSARYASTGEPWRNRFDRIVVVTAPDALKIERFLARVTAGRTLSIAEQSSLRQDAEARLSLQRILPALMKDCITIPNTGDVRALQSAVDAVWAQLVASSPA